MIIIMKPGATAQQLGEVLKRIEQEGLRAHLSRGQERTLVGVIGTDRRLEPSQWTQLDGVDSAIRVTKPYKLASREMHPENTVIEIGDVKIGGDEVVVMGGPCSVENRDQLMAAAYAVKAAGGRVLRGGAFKPRTSPYSFQGLGEEGLKILADARRETGLKIVTEVMATEQVEMVAAYADILQIGARNTQNYALLNAVGKTNKPVLLKRGLSGTIVELLMSAEYIMSNGNLQVMLCERGIRTYETETRNTFDLNAIPVLHKLTHLPVVADPSHGVGHWEYVGAVTKGALAAGADSMIIEVHHDPAAALSDGGQSLNPQTFSSLMDDLRLIARAIGRSIAPADHQALRRVA